MGLSLRRAARSSNLVWTVALVTGVTSAVAAASCSAGTDNDGEGGGNAGGALASGGSASTFATTGSSTGAFSSGGSSSTGVMPGVCDPTLCTAATGTCMNDVCVVNENPGNVDGGTKGSLDGGGSADSTFQWLYPYDATVFPRGLTSPTMQFDGTAPDAIKVRVTFSGVDYTGYYAGSSPARVKLSDAVWTMITSAAAAKDEVKVEVTKTSGGQVTGPVTEKWSVAQGNLRGTIYYETYGSQLAGAVGIMKLSPGASQPTVLKTGCGNVCHTASADGSTLVASAGAFASPSVSYDLKNNAAAINTAQTNQFVYAGLYPDGSFAISSTNYRLWLGQASRLYDTKTGANIPTPSWDSVITNASMPAFSPDGKWVVFNYEDKGGGKSLATMQYNPQTKAFSNLTVLVTNPNLYLGWPAFTPDSKSVIYHAGTSAIFETDNSAQDPDPPKIEQADLRIVNVATKVDARLDATDGYANGQTYLPAKDSNLSFAPTVLPEAVGGYYWAVFTSHRSYGNTLPSLDNNDQNGKLWVAAVDINAPAGQDPSHPAFYLDGQEPGADNLRGFWVLDPCKQNDNVCVSGDECCGGYCREGKCTATPSGCSQDLEKCTTAADCCASGDACINDHCAAPPPA